MEMLTTDEIMLRVLDTISKQNDQIDLLISQVTKLNTHFKSLTAEVKMIEEVTGVYEIVAAQETTEFNRQERLKVLQQQLIEIESNKTV